MILWCNFQKKFFIILINKKRIQIFDFFACSWNLMWHFRVIKTMYPQNVKLKQTYFASEWKFRNIFASWDFQSRIVKSPFGLSSNILKYSHWQKFDKLKTIIQHFSTVNFPTVNMLKAVVNDAIIHFQNFIWKKANSIVNELTWRCTFIDIVRRAKITSRTQFSRLEYWFHVSSIQGCGSGYGVLWKDWSRTLFYVGSKHIQILWKSNIPILDLFIKKEE